MTAERIESLIARLEKGRLKTREIFSTLATEQWLLSLYDEPLHWDIRALLAHFVSSEERLLELVQDVAAGGQGVNFDFDFDAFNAEEQIRLQGQSPEKLLAYLEKARTATLAWVRTLTEGQLDLVGRHPALGEISLETMITAIYGHQLLHMRDLRSKIER